jgi:hypothetical protein
MCFGRTAIERLPPPNRVGSERDDVRVLIAIVIACSVAVPCHADDATPRRTGARIGWTLAGVGIGFGAGTWIGFSKFDQATYAERKITTTAVSCAAAGGVIAFLLTRHRGRPAPNAATSSSTTPSAPIRR